MLHISLFSGIGGFEIAAELVGWTNIASCEISEFPRKVLQYHFPDSYHHDDIHTLTYEKLNDELTKRFGENWRSNEIVLSGGFPCQPYSHAGKREGKNDARHLWPEMLRVIRELKPTWVVGENVYGLVSWNGGMVFSEVHTDLETEGFEVQAYVLPAAGVNAPHRRDRVWFVAYSAGNRTTQDGYRNTNAGRGEASVPPKDKRWEGETIQSTGFCDLQGIDPNSEIEGLLRRSNSGWENNNETKRSNVLGQSIGSIEEWISSNSTKQGLEGCAGKSIQGGIDGFTRQYNEVDGFRYWQDFPSTEPAICRGNDGISDRLDGITFSKWRNESIKAYGNAIVPQVAYQIFKTIQAYEQVQQQEDHH